MIKLIDKKKRKMKHTKVIFFHMIDIHNLTILMYLSIFSYSFDNGTLNTLNSVLIFLKLLFYLNINVFLT